MPSIRQRVSAPHRAGHSLPEIPYALRERRRLILLVAMLLTLLVLVPSLLQKPVYTAKAVVEIRPTGGLGPAEDPNAFLQEVRGAVIRDDMLEEVMKQAGWEGGSQEFRDRINVDTFVGRNESGLRVRFAGTSAQQASRAANSYASLFVERVKRLGESRLAGGTLAATARVSEAATPPESASSPRVWLRAAVAAAAGLLVGSGLALFLESRAKEWRGAQDAEFVLRVPVLGTIPEHTSGAGQDVS